MASPLDIELSSPPTDTPSRVKFSPVSNHLLVSAWDSSLRFYDVDGRKIVSSYSFRGPVLDCAFTSDGDRGFGVSVDGSVRVFNLKTEQAQVLGYHEGVAARSCFASTTNSLVTGGWDHTLRVWDPRQSKSQASRHQLSERVYDMDISPSSNLLVVGMAGRLTEIWDVRKMNEPVQKRESSLKFMTRSVACMHNGEGYANGSAEGRIAVEYFDPSSEVQKKKYAFKCHRATVDGEDIVAPVNALAFHPLQGTFASAGSDGAVCIWDHAAKKRLRQYPKYHSAVTSVAFNKDGSKMAIGVGYLHPKGLGEPGGKSSIFIKTLDSDSKK